MPKDDRRRVSEKQERGAARRLGARRHSGSGSGSKRLDMHTDNELVECKTVLEGNTQITLKAEALRLLTYHAALQDREPVMHVQLDRKCWVLIPEEYYLELRDAN